MRKSQIKIGGRYTAKVSGKLVTVRITAENPRGGWDGVNTETGRAVRFRTAGRLRATAGAGAQDGRALKFHLSASKPGQIAVTTVIDAPINTARPGLMPTRCGCCDSLIGTREPGAPGLVYRCDGCGGLVGACRVEESYGLVRPQFAGLDREREMTRNEEATRYFDLLVSGNGVTTRRHGWFDPATRTIVQVG